MTFVEPMLLPILPELVLGVGAMLLLMLGAFKGDEAFDACVGLAIALLLGAAILIYFIPDGRITTFADDQAIGLEGSFILDDFARFMKVLILLGSAAAIVMSVDWMRIERLQRFEYPVLILLSATGMLVMVSANDLIALYMGIELQALAAYVIATINRDNLRSTEAGLKYFVLGALSSGMLLYGMSLVYGFTGAVSLPGIAAVLTLSDVNIGLIFGIVFLLSALLSRSRPCPSTCGRLTSTRARRRRSPPSSPPRPRSQAWRSSCASWPTDSFPSSASGSRSSPSSPSPR